MQTATAVCPILNVHRRKNQLNAFPHTIIAMPGIKKYTKKFTSKPPTFEKGAAIYLVIVESPSKCMKIEQYLGPLYKCIASKGHIREIDGLKSIDQKTFEPKFNIVSEKKDHVEFMRSCIQQFKPENIYLASDDDREGEAIAWHICDTFNLSIENTPRIIFHEITKPAILESLNHKTRINMNLVRAQHARQILDIIVGYKISPALWKQVYHSKSNSLSAGRCQTPALRLVYDNEKEKERSESEYIYKTTGTFLSQNIAFDLNHEFTQKQDVIAFLEKTKTHKHSISFDGAKESLRSAPSPLNTSKLLQFCNNKLGYSPTTTMQICQILYQNGHITYMRTDNTKYSDVFLKQLGQSIEENYGKEYLGNFDKIENKDSNANPHEAIRVTDINVKELPVDANPREASLYRLIWRNTMESGMADAKYNVYRTKIRAPELVPKKELYYENILELPIFLGWQKVVEDKGMKDKKDTLLYFQSLSDKTKSDVPYQNINSNVVVRKKHTHYTESTLIKRLEDLGIGRPSTFATIVNTIQERGYVKCGDVPGVKMVCDEFILRKGESIETKSSEKTFGQEKNKLVIEPLGILCIELLLEQFDSFFDYGYTRDLEEELDKIVNQTDSWNKVCKTCSNEIDAVLKTIEKKEKTKYQIDDHHEVVFLDNGPVIRSKNSETGKYDYKTIKKSVDFETLKSGKCELSDLLAIPSENLGKFKDSDVLLKTGKYGGYVLIGDKTHSVKDIGIALDKITLSDVVSFLKLDEEQERKPGSNNTLRILTTNLSIRKGQYGPYLFYKTTAMKGPVFFNIKKFNKDPLTCEQNELLGWIKTTYPSVIIT
jgi:DNA topoisomerase-1